MTAEQAIRRVLHNDIVRQACNRADQSFPRYDTELPTSEFASDERSRPGQRKQFVHAGYHHLPGAS